MTEGLQTTQNRNSGIDALRILCMTMIPLLHILGHGGLLYSLEPFSIRYELMWLTETAAYCSVDCYGLISGYVGYTSRHRYGNILYLNAQVMFYTLITTGIFAVVRPETVGKTVCLHALFPFAFPVYWYYSAYFCMFFFIPFFNYLLKNMDRSSLRILMITIVCIDSILPTLAQTDPASALNGNSALWLSLLYLIGGYLRKYQIAETHSGKKNILIWMACTIAAWAGKYGYELFFNWYRGDPQVDFYTIQHTSPLILLGAVCLLNFFSGLQFHRIFEKFVRFFAPLSFGVYLFHCEPLVWNHILFLWAFRYLDYNAAQMLFAVAATALCIWFAGSMTDWIRMQLFKLFHVRENCFRLEEKCRQCLETKFDFHS